MLPDLVIPSDLPTLATWVLAWAAVIGGLCVPITDAVINGWEDRKGVIVSAADQRLVSIFLVPPVVTVVAYVLLLALGMVELTSAWLAVVFILAVATVCGKASWFAVQRKANKSTAARPEPL